MHSPFDYYGLRNHCKQQIALNCHGRDLGIILSLFKVYKKCYTLETNRGVLIHVGIFCLKSWKGVIEIVFPYTNVMLDYGIIINILMALFNLVYLNVRADVEIVILIYGAVFYLVALPCVISLATVFTKGLRSWTFQHKISN